MPLPLPLILAAAAGGLTVETDSPDALCPPLEEARQTIFARVGVVQGGAYQARYGVVHDAESGRRMVHLTLRGEAGELLLTREIPLEGTDCSDAALAMALVLERYFESAFELSAAQPVDEETKPSAQGAPVPPSATASPPADPSTPGATTEGASAPISESKASSSERQLSPVLVRAGLGISQWGALQVGIGVELNYGTWWSIALDSVFQAVRTEVDRDGYSLGTLRHGLVLAPSYVFRPAKRWSLSLGPNTGLQFQVAQILDDAVTDTSSQVRVLSSVGAHLATAFDVSRRTQVGAMGRFLGLVAGRPFVVSQRDGGATEILALPSVTWEAGLNLALRF